MKLSIVDKPKKDIFISLFQLLKSCSSIINIIFNENDMYIQGMDKSHVCLFDIKILSEWFSKYEKPNNDTNSISIDSQFFHNIISMTQDHHSINIHYDLDPDSINIDLINEKNTKGDFNKYFKLPLADLEYDVLTIQNVDYDAEFSMNAKKINEVTAQLLIFGDVMNVKCSEEKIDLISTGMGGEMLVNIPIDDLSEYSIAEGDVIDLSYSLNYIHKMCLTTKLANEIEFSISAKYPMRIKYNLEHNSYITFYIAPKIMD